MQIQSTWHQAAATTFSYIARNLTWLENKFYLKLLLVVLPRPSQKRLWINCKLFQIQFWVSYSADVWLCIFYVLHKRRTREGNVHHLIYPHSPHIHMLKHLFFSVLRETHMTPRCRYLLLFFFLGGAERGVRDRYCNKGCRSVNCLSFQNKWLLFPSRWNDPE